MQTDYTPPPEIIEKYAQVLVNFALGGGTGIKPGDVVWLRCSEASRPLYVALTKTVWQAGGHVIGDYATDTYSDDDNLTRYFYEHANDAQIEHFNRDYLRGLTKQIDHEIDIISETNMQMLAGVEPAKIMKRAAVHKPFSDWRNKKENDGQYTWTIGAYGTAAMARAAGLPVEEYWRQIIKACFLDLDNPIAKWREVEAQIKTVTTKLNALDIEWVQVTGEDMDLRLKIGADRKWVGGGGRNIPSFEIFTSPDWRGASGWARFNQPLYECGNLIEGVELRFENGVVVNASAHKNQKFLREMIATKNADKVGEFSLTDARFSRIDKFMADTLYDENIGGEFGNTHIAVGTSYHDCFNGDPARVKKPEWARRGFNDSPVHTDIVSTSDRTVTATLGDGSQKVIYKHGRFVI
ncbi:MAG: aminopeptidase [Candidatus Nomurabacteria bacterium]|jgi:aminopeptidase|nr:aminopeptidase [Candidatus Nomurabacteria bacterium]